MDHLNRCHIDEKAQWQWNENDVEVPIEVIPPPSPDEGEDPNQSPTQSSVSPSPSTNSGTPSRNPKSPSISQSSRLESSHSSPAQQVRRSQRDRCPPSYLEDYQCNHTIMALFVEKPQNFQEAAQEERWIEAMNEEIRLIEKNDTWELVDKPQDKDEIGMETIRSVLALAAQFKLQVYQLDVKSAFLNGELEEEVYVEQPQGYIIKGKEDKVYRLRKALYGLKQAPRA